MAGRTLSRPDRAPATGPDVVGPATTASSAGRPIDRSNTSAVVRRRGRQRSQVRGQWLVLAAALTVLAGILVAWSLDRAADRVDVVSVARRVPAGTVIQPGDLTTTAIAFDAPVTGLAPATSLEALVGRVATVDLDPGVLLSTGMWADGSELGPDERTVGALLDAGTHPTGIAPGSLALAVSVDGADASPDVMVRVLDAGVDARGALRVTLAVPAGDAPRIARLAAADGLVLVGVPALGDPAAVEAVADGETP